MNKYDGEDFVDELVAALEKHGVKYERDGNVLDWVSEDVKLRVEVRPNGIPNEWEAVFNHREGDMLMHPAIEEKRSSALLFFVSINFSNGITSWDFEL